jgi:hypothetical protein
MRAGRFDRTAINLCEEAAKVRDQLGITFNTLD